MAATNQTLPVDPAQEIARARALAERYYHDFVDLKVARIDHDLFHSIPVDLMFRYNFVPIHAVNGTLEIALADPRNLALIDDVRAYLKGFGIESRLTFNDEKTKANLYATIGPKGAGGVVLSGHTDVVPVDGQPWTSNPFELTARADRLFGRGT